MIWIKSIFWVDNRLFTRLHFLLEWFHLTKNIFYFLWCYVLHYVKSIPSVLTAMEIMYLSKIILTWILLRIILWKPGSFPNHLTGYVVLFQSIILLLLMDMYLDSHHSHPIPVFLLMKQKQIQGYSILDNGFISLL